MQSEHDSNQNIRPDQVSEDLIASFNATASVYPREASIPGLFAETVALHAEKVAVVYKDQGLTYAELDEVSDRLARLLLDLKLPIEAPVAILLNPGPEIAIALLGILKAGACYLALNPDDPRSRMQSVLEDTRASVLIGGKAFAREMNRLQWECAALETVLWIDSENYLEIEEAETALMKRELWEYVGDEAEDDISAGGWVDSYTGELLSREVMDDYASNILRHLRPLLDPDKSVLELGCSSGISMFQLAPLVKSYLGTDLSESILRKTEAERQQKGLENIRLERMAAIEIDQLPEQEFDLVIMNSLIQCFPGYNYFRAVFAKALEKMSNSGYFFLGDIMDLASKDALVTSLKEFATAHAGKGYKTKVDWSAELFYHQDFFADLQHEFPAISEVIILPKETCIRSELSDFRYDVLLKIDKSTVHKPVQARHRRQLDLSHLPEAAGPLPLQDIGPRQLAYISFTSGSTGKPKGVMVEHRSVIRLVRNANYISIQPGDKLSQIAPVFFDASTFEIWGALLNGATLVQLDKKTFLDARLFGQALQDNQVSITWLPTALFHSMLGQHPKVFSGTRQLVFGGELLSPDHVNLARKHHPELRLLHVYGPTENTTYTTAYEIQSDFHGPVPIGKPISNTQCFIVDENLEAVEIGVAGELCVAGDGLARGYWADEALTAAKFVTHPGHADVRMYRTGDLAKWLPGGDIEFLGRIDSQVKLRGFRIEPGEIESAFREIMGISDVFIQLQKNEAQGKFLCAYIVDEQQDREEEIKQQLLERLPEYMVPGYIVAIEKFPLKPNGKIDTAALPDPLAAQKGSGAGSNEWESPFERAIQEIWKSVMGRTDITREANFFDIGGHSLSAVQVVFRIEQELGRDINIADIFEFPTIAELAMVLEARETKKAGLIQAVGDRDFYPVSAAQRRLWMINQMSQDNTAYNMSWVYPLRGNLNRGALQEAFRALVKRHESLRTTFLVIGGKPYQKVRTIDELDFEIQFEDLRNQENRDAVLREKLYKFSQKQYDLSAGPLVSAQLLRQEEDLHIVSLTMHHIVSDGWSMEVLLHDLLSCYNALAQGLNPGLSPLEIQYRDFAVWQENELDGEGMEASRDYWIGRFGKPVKPLDLPADYPRPPSKTYAGGLRKSRLSPSITKRLNRLAEKEDASLFMVVLAAVKTLLYRYSGQTDLVVGIPVAGRSSLQLENQIGFYVNTLAMRTELAADQQFVEFLRELRAESLRAFQHDDYPFDHLVDELTLERDMSRMPLFDIMVVWQSISVSEKEPPVPYQLEILKDFELGEPETSAKFDLTFHFRESGDELEIFLEYNSDLYKEERIVRMESHLKILLGSIAESPGLRLNSLPLLPAQERELLRKYGAGPIPPPELPSMLEKLAGNARTIPNSPALRSGELEWDYACLWKKVCQISHHLQEEYGVAQGDCVGVCAPASAEMVAALLAIFALGAIYVPIDPDLPSGRKNYMIEDAGIKCLIQEGPEMDFALPTMFLNNQFSLNSHRAKAIFSAPDAPAYLIYTSGTSGFPKGVLLSHGNLSNYLNGMTSVIMGSDIEGNFAAIGSISFDFSISALLAPFWVGGTLTIPQSDALENQARECLLASGIDCLKLTPTHLSVFAAWELSNPAIRTVLVGGERLQQGHLETLAKCFPNATVFNEYGPTEATIGCTIRACSPAYWDIGQPMAGVEILIVNEAGMPQPIGVPGELYISGKGVALGYHKRPEKTREKFIPHPAKEGEIIYRSGDLAAWQTSGNLEYLGRRDRQIKIRGYRIEPQEIEQVLLTHPEISGSVIECHNDAIIAFIFGEAPVDKVALRRYLQSKIPAYMVPAHYLQLEEIPRTINGKVDQKQLLKLFESAQTGREEAVVPPATEIEKLLVQTWEEVLGRTGIGIRNNYFESGGDSIKAIQIAGRMHQLGYKLEVRSFFLHQHIEELASVVQPLEEEIDQGPVSGHFPLTPAMHEFFAGDKVDLHWYNHALKLVSRERMELGQIETVFTRLLDHHDELRCRISKVAGIPQQEILPTGLQPKVWEFDLRENPNYREQMVQESNRLQAGFDLAEAPLIQLAVFRLREEDQLLIILHHLVVDGISWRILLADIHQLFQQLQAGETLSLPAKTASFKAWSQFLKQYSQTDALRAEQDFWRAQLPGSRHQFQLEPDAQQAERTTVRANIFVELTTEQTGRLLTQAHSAFHTEINDLLIASLARAIRTQLGFEEVALMMEGHGREEVPRAPVVHRTVGWFTASYPILVPVLGNSALTDDIKSTKELLRKVPHGGIGYGVLRYLREVPELNRGNLPQMRFNYLGQFDTDVQGQNFRISREDLGEIESPDRTRSFLLDFVGMVGGGKLRLTLVFPPEIFAQPQMEALMAQWEQELNSCIDFCCAVEMGEQTPADFYVQDLSLSDLDSIFDDLNN